MCFSVESCAVYLRILCLSDQALFYSAAGDNLLHSGYQFIFRSYQFCLQSYHSELNFIQRWMNNSLSQHLSGGQCKRNECRAIGNYIRNCVALRETKQAKIQEPPATVHKNKYHAKPGLRMVFYAWRGTGFACVASVAPST